MARNKNVTTVTLTYGDIAEGAQLRGDPIIVAALNYPSNILRNYLKMDTRHCLRNHRSAHASCSSPR